MGGDALKKVRPGDPLSIPAAAYNAFIDAATALRADVAAGRAPHMGKWGLVRARCADPVPGPFVVVQVEQAVGPGGERIVNALPLCSKVSRPWTSRIGIAQRAGAEGDVIPVRTAGVGLVRYDFEAAPELQAGETLGCLADQFYPRPADTGDGGPLTVLAVAEYDPEWAEHQFALVEVTGRRLGSQRSSGGGQDGGFQVLVFGEGWTVVQEQPGVLLITPA